MKRIVRLSLFALAIVGLVIIYKKPTTVKADNPLVFTFSVAEDAEGITIAASNDAHTALSNGTEGAMLIGIVGDNEYSIDARDGEDHPVDAQVTCTSNKSCTVTVANTDGVRFVTSGDTPYTLYIGDEEYFFTNTLLSENESIVVGNKPASVYKDFDGDAYLVWECDSKGICMHEITNIGMNNDNFDMKYYKASDMTDGNEIFDPTSDSRHGFVYSSNMEEWIKVYKEVNGVSNVDWNEVDIDYLFRGVEKSELEERFIENGTCQDGDEDALHRCVDKNATIIDLGVEVQPLGEPDFNNSYVSYGDRSFKVTIYNDDYKGVSFGNMDDLTYIPYYNLDAALRLDSVDISNTSKKNPGFVNVSLLERTLTLKSNGINGFEIKSIKALDVPSEGVVVGKNNDGDFVVSFMSHYYDDVILEITDTDGNKYYLEVSRTSYDGGIKREWQPGGGGKATVYVNFLYASNTSYSDYILTAKYVYKNGKTKVVELNNTGKIDDGLGNITFASETEGGKNLKMASYEAEIDQDYEETMTGIYFNVRYKGSTDTRYAGTFAGSGLGIYYNIEEELR